ncbi:UNVERIFIED_CONTAM: hypothetical protein FKN15_036591 [Acipenser sinensis]
MGCGLRKLDDPEDSSPGKIYSTLKRPQVETKTDAVYEYTMLDFTLEEHWQAPDLMINLCIRIDRPISTGMLGTVFMPVPLCIALFTLG